MSAQLEGMHQAFREVPVKMLLKQCDYVTIGMSDWCHGKAELALKDKEANLLQILVGMLEQM